MLRVTFLAVIVLVFSACDPLRRISVSRPIPAALDRMCVIETLRMEKAVREAGVGAGGQIYAKLIIPQNLGDPTSFMAGIEERKNDKGELELRFEKNWVGASLRPAYRAYVERTFEELRDRVIEKCGVR